ncbi:phage holin family protein [Paenibacillus pini]|uniref:Phage-related holin n=1 Tax=Paenibacillus pini JCM 16418 TaxID=1236976 RepID=W7YVM4_9BACL|nr:phage holin family protein [Paenibacillus pini]GAF06449.1 phage-related holin [Paenibacillus pini JCM 16418]
MNPLIINGVSALAGGFLALAFGSWNQILSIFLITILIDYITGVLASIKEGSGLDSQIGFWGVTRKALMLLVIVLAHQMDQVMGSGGDVIKTGAIYFYMSNELISITENYGRLGLPLPDKIRRIIAVLRNKEEDK